MKKFNLIFLSIIIFVSCVHAQTVNLRVDNLNTFTTSPATPMIFSVAGTEAARYSTDRFYQISASYTGTNKCGSGTIGIRNNAGVFQICQNADGWNPISGGGGSGLSGAGNAGFLVVYTATTGTGNSLLFQTGSQVLLGGTSTDVTGTNITTLGNNTGFVAAGATTNASALSLSIVNGSYSSIASNRTGSGTYLPLTFSTNGAEQTRLLTTGPQWLIGGTSTDLSIGSNPYVVTIGNNSGFAAAGAATNASLLSLTIVNSTYAALASNRTGSGAYLPLAFFANGVEVARFARATNQDGSLILGNTTTDLVLTPSFVTIGNNTGFVAAGAASNASVLSMGIVNGSYASIASNKTGSGTFLPISMFVNGGERFRIDTNGTNAQCIWINGGLRRLTLSGSNVIDGGAC